MQIKMIIGLIFLIYIMFVFLLITFWGDIDFSPNLFLSEYAKFLSTLSLALFSFWAFNYLWSLNKDIVKENYKIVKNIEKLPHLISSYKEHRTKINIYIQTNYAGEDDLKVQFSSLISDLEKIYNIMNNAVKIYPSYAKKKYIFLTSDWIEMLNSIKQIIDDSKSISNINLFITNTFTKTMDKNEPKLLDFFGEIIKYYK